MKIFTKRAFKRIGIALGLLFGVALLVNGIFAWKARHRLDSLIAEVKAAGEPTDLADLAPKPIPPEKNAAAQIQKVDPQIRKFSKEWLTFDESRLGKDWNEREEHGDLPTAEQLAAMRKVIDSYPEILSALQTAVECNEYFSLADFSLLPSAFLKRNIDTLNNSVARGLGRFVGWKMRLLAADGEPDKAIQLGIKALQFARLYDHEPLIINYMLSISLRSYIFEVMSDMMYRYAISPGVRAELDRELAQQDDQSALAWAYISERAFSISYVQEQLNPILAMLRWPMSNWMLGELDVEMEAVAATKRPLGLQSPQSDNAPYQLNLGISEWNSRGMPKVGSLIGPAISSLAQLQMRWTVWARTLRILNALGDYRQRNGKEADSIEQLGLPKEAITDPWSGSPLIMKKTDQGWLVYSVGPRGVDNGGKLEINWSEGVEPPGYSAP